MHESSEHTSNNDHPEVNVENVLSSINQEDIKNMINETAEKKLAVVKVS